MKMKEKKPVVNSEEEFRKLREKTDHDELAELKRGLMGGYRGQDVAEYVERLKCQMQTAEKTFKSHIAELNAEKDQLRYERDELQSRLENLDPDPDDALHTQLQNAKQEAEAFLADKVSLQEQLSHATRMADESIADMQKRLHSLGKELDDARERSDALQKEFDTLLAEEKEACRAELEAAQAEREGLQVQLEAYIGRAEENEVELRGAIEDWKSRAKAEQARAADAMARLEAAGRQMERLRRDRDELASQLETAWKSIAELLNDKEALNNFNERLRKSLNSLVVKTDAVIKENNVSNALLESEREKVSQYQEMSSQLSDMLTRVQVANQMLEERVVDLGKVMEQKPPKKFDSAKQYRPKAELHDFSDRRDPLHDIICELNAIQTSLAQYQQPQKISEEREKKSNIRYSVEKLEVDCPGSQTDDNGEELDEFRVQGGIENRIKTR